MSGFDPHVQDQLNQLSFNQRSRQNSFPSRSASAQNSCPRNYSTYIHPRGMPRSQQNYQNCQTYGPRGPPGPDAFPPLGAQQSPSGTRQQYSQPNWNQPYNAGHRDYSQQSAAQDFFGRVRYSGNGRGRGNRYQGRQHPGQTQDQDHQPVTQTQHVYHQVTGQQRQRQMEQADYLQAVSLPNTANMLSKDEIHEKHHFRERLEIIAKQVVDKYIQRHNLKERPNTRLQSYGSLSNGFGLTGCDVDLLLTMKDGQNPYMDVPDEIKRDLEKALLDDGIGAHLLTNTRIPIIKVCEKPGPELLKNLRDHRFAWEVSAQQAQVLATTQPDAAPLPTMTQAQDLEQATAALELDGDAANMPLPASPVPDNTKLEFIGDCGIQCDINFTNRVALYNTRLLWLYGKCDPRVRLVGVFVKNWAKARDINTPYHGTLSSYGYVLMVLHYLMNVARPPLIPNLQLMATNHGWDQTPKDPFEGYDVRFTHDTQYIQDHLAQMVRNNQSVGGLLQGLFRYYGHQQDRNAFQWTQDVISIRTEGGLIKKRDKGWTEAKWSGQNSNVRLRYLVAIEDPFELNHNIGRTVGHNGIVAIREEFRRAHAMIEGIQRVQTTTGLEWIWRNAAGEPKSGFDLVEPVAKGDLLRKDQEARKEKARKMRQEMEEKEAQAKAQALLNREDEHLEKSNGTSIRRRFSILAEADGDATKLIHDVQHQDDKVTRMRSRFPERKRLHDEEFEQDESSGHKIDSEQQSATSEMVSDWNVLDQQPGVQSASWSQDRQLRPAKAQTQEITSSRVSQRVERIAEDQHEPPLDPPVERMNWTQIWDVQDDSTKSRAKYGRLADTSLRAPPPEPTHTAQPAEYQPRQDGDMTGSSVSWQAQNEAQTDEPANGSLPELELDVNSMSWTQSWEAPANVDGEQPASVSDSNAGPAESTQPAANTNFQKGTGKSRKSSDTTDFRIRQRHIRQQLQEMQNQSHISNGVDIVLNGCSEPWFKNVRNSQSNHDTRPVGEEIAWTRNSKAGQWLLKRDCIIRTGEFKAPTSTDYGRLHAKFPYNPSMSQAELRKKNELLEQCYAKTLYPVQPQAAYAASAPVSTVVEQVPATIWASRDNSVDRGPSTHDWPVGQDIFWSLDTRVGKWLRWRDGQVKDGKWIDNPSRDRFSQMSQRVNESFPYDSKKTFAKIERMNAELAEHFTGLLWPTKNMTVEHKSEAIRLLEEAVDRLNESRVAPNRPVYAGQHVLRETYRQIHDAPPLTIANNPERKAQRPRETWTALNDTGSWLRRRDELISKGIWRGEELNKDSVFCYLNELYPYNPDLPERELAEKNREIEAFFTDIILPRPKDGIFGDEAIRAVLKVVERRKGYHEAERIKTLLGLFTKPDDPQTFRPELEAVSQVRDHSREEAALKTVQALSEQAAPQPHDADFVRQRRLAFFSKPTATVSDNQRTNPNLKRRDSAVQGLWNASPHNSRPGSNYSEHSADPFKPRRTGQSTGETYGTQNDPATTDESEVIPNTLKTD